MEHCSYPTAPKRPVTEDWHGVSVTDDYSWMESPQSPDTLDWVAAENVYTDRFFQQHLPGMVDARVDTLKARKGGPAYANITRLGKRFYATRQEDGNYQPVLLDAQFQEVSTLLTAADLNNECIVFSVSPSPADDGVCAYFVLYNGAPRPSLLIRDDRNQRILARMDGLFSYGWAPDGSCIYYSDAQAHPESGTNSNYIRRWSLASSQTDTLYDCTENAVFCTLSVALDGTLFVKVCLNYHDVKLYHIDPAACRRVCVSGDCTAAFDYLGTIGSQHYILTDLDAPHSRILALDTATLSLAEAKEVLPQEKRILIGGAVLGDKLITLYSKDVVSVLELRDANGTLLHPISLPDAMGAVSGQGALCPCEAGNTKLLFAFESFLCPPSVLEYDAAADTLTTLYREREPEESAGLTVEQIFVAARDGVQVPAFLVHRKDLTPTGGTPTLMYGYGGYGVAMPPWYHNPFVGLDIPEWCAKGYLYVHCNMRGGSEYGSQWHSAGNLNNKKNVFHDFIDITERVIADGWTSPDKIAICGGSNGGLLVSALATMRPDLFRAVIASVPHTDMIHFSRDDRGPMYITEYGDPNDPELFQCLYSYSPYHNVHDGVLYPAMYIQTGEFDNNVPPYHGKKFAARLQAAANPSRPVLLRVLARGSHDRGAGEVFYRTTAEMQTFIALALGCKL